MTGISNKQDAGENDEWWEVLEVANSTLRCQLDAGSYASVIQSTQLQQVELSAQIKQTKKTLVLYSQHGITPKGYVTLPVRFKDTDLDVYFYVIDGKQKTIFSGKVCEAFNLVQRVHKIHVDASLRS